MATAQGLPTLRRSHLTTMAKDDWSDDERGLWDDAWEEINREHGGSLSGDRWAEFLYHEAMWDFELSFEDRGQAYHALHEYMLDEYGIDFDEVFDWDTYREKVSPFG